MKVTIDGTDYPFAKLGEWTYEEADAVERVAQLTAGQVHAALLSGSAKADLAFAVVSFVRAHPDRDPALLRRMRIDQILVDYTNPDAKPDEGGDVGPPAEGAGAGRERGAARRQRRKS